MNKKQKQLIDTYFRKREIAVGVSFVDFEQYENVFLMMQGKKPIIGEISDNALDLIMNPHNINNLKHHINELSGYDVSKILIYHPFLIDDLPIETLNQYDISYILNNQPSLVHKLPVETLNSYNVSRILLTNSSLVDDLPLENMDNDDIRYLLKYRSYLWSKFEERGLI